MPLLLSQVYGSADVVHVLYVIGQLNLVSFRAEAVARSETCVLDS